MIKMNREQFLKILPAYMGCELCWKDGKDEYSTILQASEDMWDYDGYSKFSELKLVLRPMNEMKDAEKNEAEGYFQAAPHGFISRGRMNFQHRNGPTLKQMTSGINYLRSIGIDCDGLIEAGFADKQQQINGK